MSLPPQDYVARHCKGTWLAYGPDGEPAGVTEAAFRPRPDETDGISVVSLNYFGPSDRRHQLNCVRSVISLTATGKHRLALIQVGDALAAITNAGDTPSIIADPRDELPPNANVAHALIGPADALQNLAVREAIAASVRAVDLVGMKLDP